MARVGTLGAWLVHDEEPFKLTTGLWENISMSGEYFRSLEVIWRGTNGSMVGVMARWGTLSARRGVHCS